MHYVKKAVALDDVNDAGVFEGYASVFDYKDHDGDVVCKGAFQDAILKFQKDKISPKILWQHDTTQIIGTLCEMYEDAKGLFVRGRIFQELEKGREALHLTRSGVLDALSIGFSIQNKQYDAAKKTRLITCVDLHEISLVTFGANDQARITNVKNKKGHKMNEQSNIQNLEAVSTKIETATKQLDRIVNQHNRFIQKNNRFSKDTSMPYTQETTKFELKNFIRTGLCQKSLTTANGSGAYMIPKDIITDIQHRSPTQSIRQFCNVENIGGSALELLLEKGHGGAGWVSEDAERNETDMPELIKVKIPVHEMYAKPRISQKLVDDSGINIEEWVLNRISEKVHSLENAAFLSGDGVDKPKGILSHALTHVGSGEHGKLESVKSGQDGSITVDALIDVMSALKCEYLDDATWVMSRSTLSAIRLLKDHHGQYILQTTSENGIATLMGYPVMINDAMPTLTDGTPSNAVIFGNLKKGYQIVDRSDMELMRDPYSSKPFVEFYVTKRVGGDVIDFDAIKILQCAE